MAGMCCGVVGETEAATVAASPISIDKRRTRVNIQRQLTVLSSTCDALEDESRSFSRRKRAKLEDSEPGHDPSSLQKPDEFHDCTFGMTSVCGRRRDMEDAISIRSSLTRSFSFFGVFDGHGCSHVAMRCRDRLHEIVKEEIELESEESRIQWKELMERSFVSMDKDVETWTGAAAAAFSPNPDEQLSACRCELNATRCPAVGSTAVVAVVTPESIVVSNCGDSRAVLCRNGVAVPLSVDHKPDRPDELERIEAAGGRVIFWEGSRVFGVLAMSRAIGDNYLKPYVIPLPEVTVTERSKGDECLIIASDGLWDVVTNEMACGVARMCLTSGKSDKACADASLLLTKLALARRTSDNVSVVVVDLRKSACN